MSTARSWLGATSTGLTLATVAATLTVPLATPGRVRALVPVQIRHELASLVPSLARSHSEAEPRQRAQARSEPQPPPGGSAPAAAPAAEPQAASGNPGLQQPHLEPPKEAVQPPRNDIVASLPPLASLPGAPAVPPAPASQPPAAEAPAPPETKKTPAALLFAAAKLPANLPSRSIGSYAKGCLAGAEALPDTGPDWQVMRPSRNRNWGHPALVRFIEKLAHDAKVKNGWPGLLVGDMSQPRGGPLVYGHASHQIGLDVDIWYKPMPARAMTAAERDRLPMTSVLVNHFSVDPDIFTGADLKLLRLAASNPDVERIFVHPAIKKALCESTDGDRSVLYKFRPFWGHDDHFHVRLSCPPGSTECQRQPPPASNDDGCGKELDKWLSATSRTAINLPGPEATEEDEASLPIAHSPGIAKAPRPVTSPAPAVAPPPAVSPAPAPAPTATASASATASGAATPTLSPARARITLDSLPSQCRIVEAAQAKTDGNKTAMH